MILDRILVAGGTVAGLLADPRLAALADSLGTRPTRLTLALVDRSGDPTSALRAWIERRNPAAARALGVRVIDAAAATGTPRPSAGRGRP